MKNYSKNIKDFVSENYKNRVVHVCKTKANIAILEQIKNKTSFLDDNSSYRQRFWHIINGIYSIPKCLCCNKINLKWLTHCYTK